MRLQHYGVMRAAIEFRGLHDQYRIAQRPDPLLDEVLVCAELQIRSA